MSRLGNTRPSGVSEHIEFCMLTAVERLAVGLKGSERQGPSSQDRSEKAYGHHDGLGIEEQVVFPQVRMMMPAGVHGYQEYMKLGFQ